MTPECRKTIQKSGELPKSRGNCPKGQYVSKKCGEWVESWGDHAKMSESQMKLTFRYKKPLDFNNLAAFFCYGFRKLFNCVKLHLFLIF